VRFNPSDARNGANGTNEMTDNTANLRQIDEDVFAWFADEVSDAALEAAAGARTDAALSLLGAPTVNVLVNCCGNDNTATAAPA
jgi:hypothetical protein